MLRLTRSQPKVPESISHYLRVLQNTFKVPFCDIDQFAAFTVSDKYTVLCQIERVRKMPNTRLRRDREVARWVIFISTFSINSHLTRLTDYQEVELVLRSSANGQQMEMEK